MNYTPSEVQTIKTHRDNMMNYTYISNSKKEIPYHGKRHTGYMLSAQKVAIQKEIKLCNDWLEEYETNKIEHRLHENIEAQLRLLLVKNFINNSGNY